MCGIVEYEGQDDACPIIYEGLKRLEYWGYDSAGIAVVDDTGALHLRKTKSFMDRLGELSQPVIRRKAQFTIEGFARNLSRELAAQG